jgi:hypothetical protein
MADSSCLVKRPPGHEDQGRLMVMRPPGHEDQRRLIPAAWGRGRQLLGEEGLQLLGEDEGLQLLGEEEGLQLLEEVPQLPEVGPQLLEDGP